MTTETIADFPAYRIYKSPAHRRFRHGDKIALPIETRTHGVLWYFYTLVSVEGYAIQNGECPHKALAWHLKCAEEMKDGRQRYWATQNAVCIHNGPKTKDEVTGFQWGDVIAFQGHAFQIDKAPNNNVKLTLIGEA